MSSTFWTVAMAVYLYISAARRQAQLAQRLMIWFHLICWFVPFIMACLALGFKALGRSNFIGAAGWCWIRTDHHFTHTQMILWMLWTDFLWKIIAFVVIVILYAMLKVKLRQAVSTNESRIDRPLSPRGSTSTIILVWWSGALPRAVKPLRCFDIKLREFPYPFSHIILYTRFQGCKNAVFYAPCVWSSQFPLKTMPNFQAKMSKCIPNFNLKRFKNPSLCTAHTNTANARECPPPVLK